MMRRKSIATNNIHGVGTNDADYQVVSASGTCPYYRKWEHMLERCYSGKNKAYEAITVCDDWLWFSNFKDWMEKQDWKGLTLDKDVIPANNASVYSPETCCFISAELNFFLPSLKGKGYENTASKRFQSRLSIRGVRKCFGTYKTMAEAIAVTNSHKVVALQDYIDEQTDPRVIEGLLKIREELENVK